MCTSEHLDLICKCCNVNEYNNISGNKSYFSLKSQFLVEMWILPIKVESRYAFDMLYSNR